MRVRPDHRAHLPVQHPRQRDLLRRRLRVHIHEDDRRLRRSRSTSASAAGNGFSSAGMNVRPCRFNTATGGRPCPSKTVLPCPASRPDNSAAAQTAARSPATHAPPSDPTDGPRSDDIHPRRENLRRRIRRNPRPPGRVLPVRHHHIHSMLLPQPRHQLLDRPPPRLPHNIRNKQQFHAPKLPPRTRTTQHATRTTSHCPISLLPPSRLSSLHARVPRRPRQRSPTRPAHGRPRRPRVGHRRILRPLRRPRRPERQQDLHLRYVAPSPDWPAGQVPSHPPAGPQPLPRPPPPARQDRSSSAPATSPPTAPPSRKSAARNAAAAAAPSSACSPTNPTTPTKSKPAASSPPISPAPGSCPMPFPGGRASARALISLDSRSRLSPQTPSPRPASPLLPLVAASRQSAAECSSLDVGCSMLDVGCLGPVLK